MRTARRWYRPELSRRGLLALLLLPALALLGSACIGDDCCKPKDDGGGPLGSIGDYFKDSGSGPTAKVVRLKNRSARDVKPYLYGAGSRGLHGSPVVNTAPIGPFPQRIPNGNSPGALGSGHSGDAGYEYVAYTPGYIHPSLVFSNLALAETPTLKMTVIPSFVIDLPAPAYNKHIAEVLMELKVKPNGSNFDYWIEYDIIYFTWDPVNKVWSDDPHGTTTSHATGILATSAAKP